MTPTKTTESVPSDESVLSGEKKTLSNFIKADKIVSAHQSKAFIITDARTRYSISTPLNPNGRVIGNG
jgi:hypothetical protein